MKKAYIELHELDSVTSALIDVDTILRIDPVGPEAAEVAVRSVSGVITYRVAESADLVFARLLEISMTRDMT